MKVVASYEANDGTVFNSEEQAIAYESIQTVVNAFGSLCNVSASSISVLEVMMTRPKEVVNLINTFTEVAAGFDPESVGLAFQSVQSKLMDAEYTRSIGIDVSIEPRDIQPANQVGDINTLLKNGAERVVEEPIQPQEIPQEEPQVAPVAKKGSLLSQEDLNILSNGLGKQPHLPTIKTLRDRPLTVDPNTGSRAHGPTMAEILNQPMAVHSAATEFGDNDPNVVYKLPNRGNEGTNWDEIMPDAISKLG